MHSSQKRRIDKIEEQAKFTESQDNVPNNLQGIYELEDDPESETHKQLQELYSTD